MRPKVKICGITNFRDAAEALRLGADALGFIFYAQSPRAVTPEQAGAIIRSLPSSCLTVGVFVNAPHATIAGIVGSTGLQAIQLSGDEPPGECRGFGVPVIKAIRPRAPEDVKALPEYPVAAVLLDGCKEGLYGGTGRTVDATLARACADRFRIILAGGLTPANVRGAIESVRPFAIDINSGVESAPGTKDHRLLAELFQQIDIFND